jgi:hypothetical protein
MRFTLKQLFLAIGLMSASIILLLPYFTDAEPVFKSNAGFICVPFVGGALIGASVGAMAKRRVWIGFGALAGAVTGGLTLYVLMSIWFGSGGLCRQEFSDFKLTHQREFRQLDPLPAAWGAR